MQFKKAIHLIGVDHRLEEVIADIVQRICRHVQADGSIQQHTPQLKERVQRQGGDVRLRPTITSLLDVFLKLDPSGFKMTLL